MKKPGIDNKPKTIIVKTVNLISIDAGRLTTDEVIELLPRFNPAGPSGCISATKSNKSPLVEPPSAWTVWSV